MSFTQSSKFVHHYGSLHLEPGSPGGDAVSRAGSNDGFHEQSTEAKNQGDSKNPSRDSKEPGASLKVPLLDSKSTPHIQYHKWIAAYPGIREQNNGNTIYTSDATCDQECTTLCAYSVSNSPAFNRSYARRGMQWISNYAIAPLNYFNQCGLTCLDKTSGNCLCSCCGTCACFCCNWLVTKPVCYTFTCSFALLGGLGGGCLDLLRCGPLSQCMEDPVLPAIETAREALESKDLSKLGQLIQSGEGIWDDLTNQFGKDIMRLAINYQGDAPIHVRTQVFAYLWERGFIIPIEQERDLFNELFASDPSNELLKACIKWYPNNEELLLRNYIYFLNSQFLKKSNEMDIVEKLNALDEFAHPVITKNNLFTILDSQLNGKLQLFWAERAKAKENEKAKIAVLTGLHPRLGINSTLFGAKQNPLFERHTLKLVFSFFDGSEYLDEPKGTKSKPNSSRQQGDAKRVSSSPVMDSVPRNKILLK